MIAEKRLGIRSRRFGGGRSLPRPRPRLIAAVVVVAALAVGAWLWLRDSSLVSVRKVTITGLSGPDSGRIRSALTDAARNMTTLDVKMHQLNTAVGPYPLVKKLQVSTQFPHGMRIRVIEQTPVAVVDFGGHTIAVAGDGTLLRGARTTSRLPTVALRSPPGGSQLTSDDGLSLVTLLAAAPHRLLSYVSQASSTSSHGLVVQLRNGPSIYFGDTSQLEAKWTAATEVLANSGSAGAQYIDVTDPDRPVAGAVASAAASSSATGASSSATGASTSATGSTTTSATSAPVTPTTGSSAGTTATTTTVGAGSTPPSGG
jgi:cell division protein FtsQ